MRPIVLDLDASVDRLTGELRIDLAEWQGALRFACSTAHLDALRRMLEARLPAAGDHGTVLMGSGDFHHLSWPLIARQIEAAGNTPLRVVVFDNHPDNMRFPFGVHCGSWVSKVAALSGVAHVDVVGITSADIGARHSWENRLAPLRAGRLTYWSAGVDTGWARWLGLASAFRGYADLGALIDCLCMELQASSDPVYVSIDKDVFSTDVVQTNWDQGGLTEAQLEQALQALQGRVVGSDITGEISAYRYRSRWKRWLSRLDGQDTELDPDRLAAFQAKQQRLNERLVRRLVEASVRGGAAPTAVVESGTAREGRSA
jgi:hypothetical protein